MVSPVSIRLDCGEIAEPYLVSMLFISSTSKPDEQGQGGSIFSAVNQIAGVLVLALTTIVSDRVAEKESAKLGVDIIASKTASSAIPKPALLKGYQGAFYMVVGFCALGGLVVGIMLRKMGNVGKKKAVSTVESTSASA